MSRNWRLPVAVVVALVVAEAGVLLLRPRDRGPEPLPVTARAYFSPSEIRRAEDFRGPQRRLFGAQMAIELGVLVLLVARPPRLRRAAGNAAVVSVAVAVAALPLAAVSRERARDVGLVTQSVGGWLGDVAKQGAIGAGLAAAGGALLVVSMKRLGRRWWIAGAVAVVAFGGITTWAGPVVLDPLFNDFTPLREGALRRDVLRLADAAGVDVGEVYVMDASRRTTAANAYVAGIGHTKRVVLYDTLLEKFTPREVRLVVAHELTHVSQRDLPRGLLYLVLVAPFGVWALAQAVGHRPGPRTIPAAALTLALLVPALTIVSNGLSRDVEKTADFGALKLTRDAPALVGFERRITLRNVGDPDPPALWQWAFGTHPTTLERIGQARAFAAGLGDSRP